MSGKIKYLEIDEEQQAKRMSRFLMTKDEILELAQQLEHDLSYFGDYVGSEKLFEAKKHATAIYYIVKSVGETG